MHKLWHAASLGMLERLTELLGADHRPAIADVDQALWHACAGGQRREAELLVGLGANLGFTPDYGHGTILDAAVAPGTQRAALVSWLEGLGVKGN